MDSVTLIIFFVFDTLIFIGVLAWVLSRRSQQRNSQMPPSAFGSPIEPSGPIESDDIRDLLRRGQKLHAIKRYREGTGAGLKEAKDAIEEIERQMGQNAPSNPPLSGPSLSITVTSVQEGASDSAALDGTEIVEMVRRGQKIEAIKLYRELTDCDLKEAKDSVEFIERTLKEMQETTPNTPPAGTFNNPESPFDTSTSFDSDERRR